MTLQSDCLGKTPLTKEAVQVIYDLRSDNRPQAVLQTWLKNLCLSHERLRAELTGLEIVHNDTTKEVASVLMLMDGLTMLSCHDEGVFRRCRDRLRKLVGG